MPTVRVEPYTMRTLSLTRSHSATRAVRDNLEDCDTGKGLIGFYPPLWKEWNTRNVEKFSFPLLNLSKGSLTIRLSQLGKWRVLALLGHLQKIPKPTRKEEDKLFKSLHKSGFRSAILSVVPPYSDEFVPKPVV